MANGIGSGPAQYALAQQERQDQSMRNILNLIMSLKQYKQEEGRFDYKKQQDVIQNDFERQRTEAYTANQNQPDRTTEWQAKIAYAQANGIPIDQVLGLSEKPMTYGPEIESAIEGRHKMAPGTFKGLPNKVKEALFQTHQRTAFPTPTSGGGPTDYDKKAVAADKLLAANKITPQEHTRIVTGYSESETPAQTSRQRQTIDLTTKRALGNVTSDPRWFKNKDLIDQVHSQGLFPDYPLPYNLAQARNYGGVGDDADIETISKYDQMFRFFNDKLKGKMKRKDFLKMNIPGIDRDAILNWYNIYE